MFCRAWLIVNLVVAASQASAGVQRFANYAEFENYITQFTAQQFETNPDEDIHVTISQLDEHMKLPSCSTPIEAAMSQPGISSATNAVVLQCKGVQSWSLYVPVKISINTNVVVATHMIRPSDVIAESDLTIQKRDKFAIHAGYFTDTDEVAGHTAASVIPAGGVFSARSIKKIPLIRKKQTVALVVKHGSIEISMTGIAKSDGYLHEYIKVLNPSSKKEVDAEVVANGTAVINY